MKIYQFVILAFISFLYTTCVYSQNSDSVLYKAGYLLVKYDSVQKNSTSDSLILAIGRTSSIFYSELTRQGDEMISKMLDKLNIDNNKSKSTNIQIPFKRYGTTQKIYKEFKEQKIIVKDKIVTDDYYYQEPLDIINWKIHGDTISIAGYMCQKAEADFRGRHFIAWFTNEINISNGPMKFGGLPGLIIKISDDKKIFSYSLCFFEKADNELMPSIVIDKKMEVTRSQMSSIKKAFFENPLAFINAQGNVHATVNLPNSGPVKKYEPLELEKF
jgi:GLPGLI family protein